MFEISKSDYFEKGKEGVKKILTSNDNKIDIVKFDDKELCYVKSGMGYPAIYPVNETYFEPKAEAILMDLDGTTLYSEAFWMWIIEKTTARLLDKPNFKIESEDEPFISGYSISEHLQYMIDKYSKGTSLELARKYYSETVDYELNEILNGRGKQDAFTPVPNLREFLTTVKNEGIKIGLVTSAHYNKAITEITSVFKQLNLGNPIEFYDAIITAGQTPGKGHLGTMGELEPKPHPWLYAEAMKVGLGIPFGRRHRIIAIEDSAAGVISVKLSGISPVGVNGGNIDEAGVSELCDYRINNLLEVLNIII